MKTGTENGSAEACPAFKYRLAEGELSLEVAPPQTDAVLEKLYEIELLDYTEHLRLQGQVGVSAARSLFLLNGGAIAGILTFIGNVGADIVASQIRLSIYFFVAGLVLAAGAPLTGYLAQVEFQQAAHRQMLDFMRIKAGNSTSDNRATFESKGYRRIGIGVVLCVLSLTFFSLGAITAVRSLKLVDSKDFVEAPNTLGASSASKQLAHSL